MKPLYVVHVHMKHYRLDAALELGEVFDTKFEKNKKLTVWVEKVKS